MTTIRVLHIPTSGRAGMGSVETTAKAYQALIGGGYVERVASPAEGDGWNAYGDEDGMGKQLDRNRRATGLAIVLGCPCRTGPGGTPGYLLGDVFFTGPTVDGEDTDFPYDRLVGEPSRLARETRMAAYGNERA